ncbi:hypothetical protein Tco_0052975 [Tanacetum coccineum]
MTKKINVHPEWLILQTLTNGAKRKLDHLLLHLVNGLLWKTNDKSGTPHSQSGWKISWAKKDDKEDECASRVEDSSNTNQWGKKEAGSSPPSSGKWAAKRKLMMRVGPLVLSLDGKLLGTRRMTKKINVHPEWLTLQTLTNVAKRKLDHLLLHLSGWKTSWDKKDDKEDQCASRVEDSSNTNQWGKKEAGSSPPSSGKWAAKRKLMMRVGPLVLSLDGKLLGPRRMTKKINVHPEWKILQTLTNGAKRKLRLDAEIFLLLHLVNGVQNGKTNGMRVDPSLSVGWKYFFGTRRMTQEDQCASGGLSLQTLTNVAKRKLDHPFSLWMTRRINVHHEWLTLHKYYPLWQKWKMDHSTFICVKWAVKKKTNDESGTPRSKSGWKTSWDKKDDKEDQCASRVEDSSNTNQCGKKEAGSSPPSSGKWAAKRKLMMRVGPLVLSLDGKLLGPRRMDKRRSFVIEILESGRLFKH